MNVSEGNSKEIFELFTNKLVFSVSVSQRWRIRWRSWLAIPSLDAPLERSASSRIIMKEFLFSIWFISLSSHLKLSIDIFIMSVRHVFADFRFIFVKCSCSRRDGTSLFSLFYKIILYIQGSRLRPKCDHFLSVRVKIWRGLTCASAWSALLKSAHCQPQHIVAGERFHWSGASASVEPGFTPHAQAEQRQRRSGAYAEREQRAPIVLSLATSARAWRCASGGFGFQTKVKDRFLNQRRWTCWYSCRENMQVLSATDS